MHKNIYIQMQNFIFVLFANKEKELEEKKNKLTEEQTKLIFF